VDDTTSRLHMKMERRRQTTKLGMINTKHVLWYWQCSPKLLGCHNLSVPPFHRSY